MAGSNAQWQPHSSGALLPGCHQPDVAVHVPIYTKLQSLFYPGREEIRPPQGQLERGMSDLSLSSF